MTPKCATGEGALFANAAMPQPAQSRAPKTISNGGLSLPKLASRALSTPPPVGLAFPRVSLACKSHLQGERRGSAEAPADLLAPKRGSCSPCASLPACLPVLFHAQGKGDERRTREAAAPQTSPELPLKGLLCIPRRSPAAHISNSGAAEC